MSYFSKFSTNGIPFMESAQKGDLKDIISKPVHITDFGFANGQHGKYAVIQVAEMPAMFYIVNDVITEILQQIADDNQKEALANEISLIVERTSKAGNTYRTIKFFDNEKEYLQYVS